MVKPFPIRESSLFSLAEGVSRLLGLLFLARFVTGLGLMESAALRMTLPLVSVVAAFSSIGLPQALTRLFAAAPSRSGRFVPRSLLVTLWQAMGCSAVLTLFAWCFLFDRVSVFLLPGVADRMSGLFVTTIPLLLLMSVTGSLRGALLGLGSTYAPAIAQVLEVASRLAALYWLLSIATVTPVLYGAKLGFVTLTIGEAVAALFLGFMLSALLRKRGVVHDVRFESARVQFGRLLIVLRMALGSTGQSLLASLGFALELPVAQALLRESLGATVAVQKIAEYSAIALPLLCAPMVLTDGMAQALLPLTASERAEAGRFALAVHLRRVIGAVAMVALPVTGALLVLAPVLSAWFGASQASTMLQWLCPVALPLYLQAPLSALLQAQGYSRGLLYAGLVGDSARLGGLWLFLRIGSLGGMGIAAAFACSVLLQTGMLFCLTTRIIRWSVPWRTLRCSAEAAFASTALLDVSLHVQAPYGFTSQPLLWLLLAVAVALFFLLLAEEITPLGLARLPWVGRFLGAASERVAQRLVDR